MSYSATVYKVMIASPSDVEQERRIIREVIQEWNYVNSEDRAIVLMPVGWETHSAPSMGARPQEIVNKQVLAECDLLTAVFWTRIGTPTGQAPSGTVEEIEKHVSEDKPTMVYFSSAPVHPDSVDEAQYKVLREFKAQCREKGLVEEYGSLSEFKEKFTRQLALTVIREYVAASLVSIPDNRQPEIVEFVDTCIASLSDEAKQLLLEAAKDRHGTILVIRTFGGLAVQTNGINFVESGNPRSEAQWEKAVEDLRDSELIRDPGHKGEVFQLTADGYEIADKLSMVD